VSLNTTDSIRFDSMFMFIFMFIFMLGFRRYQVNHRNVCNYLPRFESWCYTNISKTDTFGLLSRNSSINSSFVWRLCNQFLRSDEVLLVTYWTCFSLFLIVFFNGWHTKFFRYPHHLLDILSASSFRMMESCLFLDLD